MERLAISRRGNTKIDVVEQYSHILQTLYFRLNQSLHRRQQCHHRNELCRIHSLKYLWAREYNVRKINPPQILFHKKEFYVPSLYESVIVNVYSPDGTHKVWVYFVSSSWYSFSKLCTTSPLQLFVSDHAVSSG